MNQPTNDQTTDRNTQENPDDENTKETLPAPAGPYAAMLQIDVNAPLDEEPNKSVLAADIMPFCEGGYEQLLHEIEGLEHDEQKPDPDMQPKYRSALMCGISMVRWLEATATASGVECDAKFIARNINAASRAVRERYRMVNQLQPIAEVPMEHLWARKLAYKDSNTVDESCTNPKCVQHHPETAFDELKAILADPRGPYQGDELLVGTDKQPFTAPANSVVFGDYAMPFGKERDANAHRSEMLGFEEEAVRVNAPAEAVEHVRATVVVGIRMARMLSNVLATLDADADRAKVIFEQLPVVVGYACQPLLGRIDNQIGVEALKWVMKYWQHGEILLDIVEKERDKQKAARAEALMRQLGLGPVLDRMGGRVNVIELGGATLISL